MKILLKEAKHYNRNKKTFLPNGVVLKGAMKANQTLETRINCEGHCLAKS